MLRLKINKILLLWITLKLFSLTMVLGTLQNEPKPKSGPKSLSGPLLDRIVVVSRHGDRAPLRCYNFDCPKMVELWPMGYGYLTAIGKLRMYQTGMFLRYRYAKQFPGRYISPRDVYIRSSPIDRCLETSQLIAASLSPPIGPWIWSTSLFGQLWHPVPVFTVPKADDGLLNPTSRCALAEQIEDWIPESQVARNFMESHREFLQNISQQYLEGERLDNYRQVRELFDNLLALKHHGQPMPKWVTFEIYKRLKSIFETSFIYDFTAALKPELRILRSGVLMMEIMQRLNVENEAKKLNIYVTHDSQLYHLLDALGFDMTRMNIKFGCFLMFEYSHREDHVRLFLVNQAFTKDPMIPIELQFPVCEKNLTRISLRYLMQRYQHLLIDLDQWNRLCQNYPVSGPPPIKSPQSPRPRNFRPDPAICKMRQIQRQKEKKTEL